MTRGRRRAWTASLRSSRTHSRGPRSAAASSDRSSGMSISRRRVRLRLPLAVPRRKALARRRQPPRRRMARSDRSRQRVQSMHTRTDSGRPRLARRIAAGLGLAVAVLGSWTPASAGKPRAAESASQPDTGGFQLTEKVRIPADVRADYDNALRALEEKQYDQGIALLLKVTEKAQNAAAAYVDLGIAYSKSGDLDKALTS